MKRDFFLLHTSASHIWFQFSQSNTSCHNLKKQVTNEVTDIYQSGQGYRLAFGLHKACVHKR